MIIRFHELVTNGAGDWASITGVIIVIFGFIVTIVNVKRSKKAAERAEIIAGKIREDSIRIDTVADCSMAISTMDQIRLLHRQNELRLLPDKYAALRKILISIKTSNQKLTSDQRTSIQKAIQNFRGIEQKVEEALSPDSQSLNVPKLNTLISKHSDSLQEVLVQIKNEIGR